MNLIKHIQDIDYTIIAIASALFGAITNILARTILKDINAKNVLGMNFLLMTGTLAIFSPWFFKFDLSSKIFNILPTTIILVLIISLIDLLANYYYFKAFEKSEASIVTPVLSLTPGFVFIFSYFLLRENINYVQLVLASLIIFGVILISTEHKSIFKVFTQLDTYPAIFAALLFAFSAIPSKYLLENNLINGPTLYEIRGGIIGLFAVMYFGSGVGELNRIHFRRLFYRSLIVIVQWLLLYIALSIGNAGVTYTLANLTPVFVVLLSKLFLNEQVSFRKYISAILILILAALINILSK